MSDIDFILGLRGLEKKDGKIMEKVKPKCKLVGKDGNIFNLMSVASGTLKKAGMAKEASEMTNRINTQAESYEQALQIIMEYVDGY